jgi:phytoene dehydrogenase-like protein
MVDAVVIGAGHNGLVAANLLADARWDALVLEAEASPGGAVRSAELVEPGFRNDVFSAFYPLAAASPVIRGLDLERHGLTWRRSRIALAHPGRDGGGAALSLDLDETAASLDRFARGDGDGWRRLYGLWERIGEELIDALFSPFPPLRAGARLARRLGPPELLRFVRFGVLPVRRLADETFAGGGGGWLLAGNTLHSDLTPESAGGGLYGWLLSCLGQEHGYPVPQGGAGELSGALARRLEGRGGRIECDARVTEVIVREGRAVGVRTADGREVEARRAVLANVTAPALFLDLVERRHLPARLLDDLAHFEWDTSTVKVDWTLDGPIPWRYQAAREAGTIHVADGLEAMSEHTTHVQNRRVPARPFLVAGQYSRVDPTRAPEGKETFWAYTHVPREVRGDAGGDGLTGSWDTREAELLADRMEREVEERAPGFRELVRGRHIKTPKALEDMNANLVGGAINNGTAQLHQQLVFRPTPGFGRPETPVKDLYLASAAAHPGGGVHGAPGANAARAALRSRRVARRVVDLGRRAGRDADGGS